MKMNIPEKRPSDNVKLSPDFPQEEEFALGNMTDMTFYHYFYFPSLNDVLYEKFVRLNGISNKQLEKLKTKYRELLIKAALNTKRERIVIKNPLNTGKIKLLLDMFPDAKFIHIYRNPVVTYLSTNRFYKSLLPATYLQDYEESDITDNIIGNYRKLMEDYFNTKHLIPDKNLYEIKFEEFEQDNMLHMKEIYEQFDLDTWEEAKPLIQQYIQSQKQYRKNTYKITQTELERLEKAWGFAMKKLDYHVPENLQIV
jgi:hypothetical protein